MRINYRITALFLTIFILSGISNLSAQIKLEYHLSMYKPYAHYFEVQTKVTGLEKDYIDFIMPVWAPGSYLVRDFPKNVLLFSAKNGKGNELKFKKINKYTWRVYSDDASTVELNYKVYAYEVSVRTSFLDESHGYLNGTSMFMYIDNMKDLPSTLTITPYKKWKKVNTSLEPVSGKKFTYHSPNYDILADCPIEIGNQDVFSFNAAGVKHDVVMYGKGNYNADTLKKYMANVVEAESKVVGVNPNKHDTFIIHNLTRGTGGLEHLSSTTLEVNRWTYSPMNKLRRFLSTMAHEYFHLWNVKRIRPKALGPFDYTKENYTRLLWEMEGVTSYYSNVILRRIGIYTPDNFLENVAGTISSIENEPGDKVQPVADASFDAWIKAYKPNENSYNTTISYYSKGSVLGSLLDLEIINATNGKKNYDDVLRYLYKKYYKKEKRGFTEKEYQEVVENITGENLDWFFKNYVYSTNPIDYNKFFNYAGLKLIDDGTDENTFGARMSDKEVVQMIIDGTPAYNSGINVKDEIIAINNFRVNNRNFDNIYGQFNDGETVTFTVSRDNILMKIPVTIKKVHHIRYKLVPVENPTAKQKMVYKKWVDIK